MAEVTKPATVKERLAYWRERISHWERTISAAKECLAKLMKDGAIDREVRIEAIQEALWDAQDKKREAEKNFAEGKEIPAKRSIALSDADDLIESYRDDDPVYDVDDLDYDHDDHQRR